jgi:hypothetical protein
MHCKIRAAAMHGTLGLSAGKHKIRSGGPIHIAAPRRAQAKGKRNEHPSNSLFHGGSFPAFQSFVRWNSFL